MDVRVIDNERTCTRYRVAFFYVYSKGDEWQSTFEAFVEKYSDDQPEAAKQKGIAEYTQAYLIAIDVEQKVVAKPGKTSSGEFLDQAIKERTV